MYISKKQKTYTFFKKSKKTKIIGSIEGDPIKSMLNKNAYRFFIDSLSILIDIKKPLY